MCEPVKRTKAVGKRAIQGGPAQSRETLGRVCVWRPTESLRNHHEALKLYMDDHLLYPEAVIFGWDIKNEKASNRLKKKGKEFSKEQCLATGGVSSVIQLLSGGSL